MTEPERDLVRRRLIAARAGRLADATLDAAGALEAGDLPSAFAASEQAVRDGAEAMLAAFGDPPVEPSLLRRRMCRHEYLRELLRQHGDDLFGPAAPRDDQADASGVARHRLWLASHLAGQALLYGWDSVLVEPGPFRLHGGGPVRSPYTCLLRAEDGFRLAAPDAEIELSAEGAVLWTLLDGRPPVKVVAHLARLTGTEPDGITWRIRRTLARWEDEGLVLTDASDLHPAVAGRLPPSL